jgi:hypothetical protein
MYELPCFYSITYLCDLSINLEPFMKEGRDHVRIVTFALK